MHCLNDPPLKLYDRYPSFVKKLRISSYCLVTAPLSNDHFTISTNFGDLFIISLMPSNTLTSVFHVLIYAKLSCTLLGIILSNLSALMVYALYVKPGGSVDLSIVSMTWVTLDDAVYNGYLSNIVTVLETPFS